MKFIGKLTKVELDEVVGRLNLVTQNYSDPINVAENLFCAANVCYRAIRDEHRSRDGEMLGERIRFTKLFTSELSKPFRSAVLRSDAVLHLARLRPLIMDMEELPRSHDPEHPVADDIERAETRHRRFVESFSNWQRSTDNPSMINDAVDALASILYVVRCNIKHSGKFPSGPDREKVQRDRMVCQHVVPILRWLLLLLLDQPSQRLAAYGTLRPGEENSAILSDCNGSWISGFVEGTLTHANDYPYLDWRIPGDQIHVQVLVSSQLPKKWDTLDRFEGSTYVRSLIPVQLEDESLIVATTYLRAAGPGEGIE